MRWIFSKDAILGYLMSALPLPSVGYASQSYFERAETAFSSARRVPVARIVKTGPLKGSCVEENAPGALKESSLFLDRLTDPILNEYVQLKYIYQGLYEYHYSEMVNVENGELEGSNSGGTATFRLRLGTYEGGKRFWIFSWVPRAGFSFYCWYSLDPVPIS